MSQTSSFARDVSEQLFDRVAPLPALSGYERDAAREEVERIVEWLAGSWFEMGGEEC